MVCDIVNEILYTLYYLDKRQISSVCFLQTVGCVRPPACRSFQGCSIDEFQEDDNKLKPTCCAYRTYGKRIACRILVEKPQRKRTLG